MTKFFEPCFKFFSQLGRAFIFLLDVMSYIMKGKVRWREFFKQVYEQGFQSIIIISLTAMASGIVLALQGSVMMVRFGAKEYIAQIVAISLVREMSPVFTALVFSGKAGARITAEVGTMSVNDQITATRTLGVDPIEFLIVPRFLACLFVVPLLTIISEVVGITGGSLVGVYEANIPGAFYLSQTIKAVRYVDFFSGFIKVCFFSLLVSWICCYQGYTTDGGSQGVGKYTTQAVATCYISVIVSNTILTKIILMVWG